MTTRGHHGILLNEGAVADGFPVVMGVTGYGAAAATMSHAISITPGAAGDLLLLHVAHSTSSTVTVPAGFSTLSANISNPSGSPRSTWLYKVAAGTEGATLNFSTSANTTCAAHLYRIQSGSFSGTPELQTGANVPTTTTPDPPSVTPSWGSAKTLWIATYAVNNIVTTTAYPLPNNQITTAGTAVTSPRLIGSCDQKSEVSSFDPGTFTISATSTAIPQTVAIRPA